MAGKKAQKTKAKTPAKRPRGAGKVRKLARTSVKRPRAGLGPAKSRTTKPARKPKQVKKINKSVISARMPGGFAGPSAKPKKKITVNTAVPGASQNIQPAAQKKKVVKLKATQQSQDRTAKPARKPPQVKKINNGMLTMEMLQGIAGPSQPKKKNPVKTAVPGDPQNVQPTAQQNKAIKRKLPQTSQAAESIKRRKPIKDNPEVHIKVLERPSIHFSSPPIQPPSVIHVHPVQPLPPLSYNPPPMQGLYNKPQREISNGQSASRTNYSGSHQIFKDLRHFVDEHRSSLINNINPVEPILDDLLIKGLLKQEQYDNSKSKETPQSQMRELFGYVRGWGNSDKDIFLQILEAHNEPIIRGLRP